MRKIEMVDLTRQLLPMRAAIDHEISKVIDTASFIKGAQVTQFETQLSEYQGSHFAISCGNGTDALQIALMSLGLDAGDEVIIPAFAYAAVAEVILLLSLKPVLVDVDYETFNMDASLIEGSISERTRAIIPVHLFGQMADMDTILRIAATYNLFVIEDNAQSIGCRSTRTKAFSGSIGHIGCTSFFPSKNLGCFGDGGAMTTDDTQLADELRKITTHGQVEKYKHQVVGVNSRLDTMQAAVLNVKIQFLNSFNDKRKSAADQYDAHLSDIKDVIIPVRSHYSDHVFHQYTLKVSADNRSELKAYLEANEIPSSIYYPLSLHQQEAYRDHVLIHQSLSVSEKLSQEVISLPMHTQLDNEQQEHITSAVRSFYS